MAVPIDIIAWFCLFAATCIDAVSEDFMIAISPLVAEAQRRTRRGNAGRSAEHCARRQAGASGIVEIEDTADDFASRIEAMNRIKVDVHDLRRSRPDP